MARAKITDSDAENLEPAPAPVEKSTAGGETRWTENSRPDVVLTLPGMPSGHDSMIEAKSQTHVWRGKFSVFLKQFTLVK